MLISLNWIKEFTHLPELAPKQLGEKFTLATAEVEDVKSAGEFWKQLQVAQIQAITKHPNADSLNLVTFSLGSESRQVVCGAKNVKVGLKVPYAPIGVTLPNGMTLTPKAIRGVTSEGMLCSEEELGMPTTIDGLLEFPADAPVGMKLSDYLKKGGGVILDVDNKSLTHRPDLWGHYGMAREFATIFNQPLKNPFDQSWSEKISAMIPREKAPIEIKIENDCAGLIYLGLSIDQVQVGPSPAWLSERLEECGVRSINSLVDISNYVMLELGLPNHFFDRKKITGKKLRIHSLNENLNFKTLDGVERALVAGDTVISDDKNVLVLGGIMGGIESAVDENTNSIFIEVANWKAASVRRTSVRLGLRTDSSQRYEKSLDSRQALKTMLRLLELVIKLNPKARIIGEMVKDGADLAPPKSLNISTSANSICRQLGKKVETAEIKRILLSLGFGVQEKGSEFIVSVPTWRSTKDVECEADIVEEIGRMIGFDNITAVSPPLTIAPVRLNSFQLLTRKIEDFMALHARAFQVMTYPLVGRKSLELSGVDSQNTLKLINALSEDHDRMRPSMISSMLDAVEINRKHADEFRIFEIGRIYKPDPKSYLGESPMLAIAYFQREDSKTTFQPLLNDVERLLNHLQVPFDFVSPNAKFPATVFPANWSWIHPHEQQDIRIMGKMTGSIFSIHPLLLRQYKIKGNVTIALVDMHEWQQREFKSKIKYKPIAKFPAVSFDCTVLTQEGSAAAEVLSSIDKLKLPELEWAKIVGVYVGSDKRPCVTIKVHFLDREKTMQPERIKLLEDAVINHLEKSGFPLKK